MAVLTSSDDNVLKKRFELSTEPVTIGRHPECDVHIDDGSVSRHHAQVTYDAGQYYLSDLNSRNGTFLNNQSIHRPTKLYDRSEIQICEVTLIFSVSDTVGEVAPRPTVETDSNSGQDSLSSIFMYDRDMGESSKVMSRLEVPSHSNPTNNHVSAEKKLAALIKITHALSDSVQRDEVLAKILEFLFDLFLEADRGFVILKSEDGQLVPLGIKTRRPGDDEMIRVSRTVVNQVMDTQQPIISSDAATDDRFDVSQSIVDFRIRSIMCAPLINNKNESIGVIQLDTLKQSVAFTPEDLETFVTVAMQASLAIQKSELFEDAKRSESLRTDLELAHEIQQRFLPQRPPKIDHYEFFSYYRPMQQVGGDYFDYIALGEDKLGVIVADVVGHGIAAALLMAKVSAESRFALATSHSAVQAMTKMNNRLSGMNIDRFVTLALGLLDLNENKLSIVNAGHMPPIVRRAATGAFEEIAIEEAGLPLGIMEDFEYEAVDIDLANGDIVVLYTDGINEAMNAAGQQLTTEAMIRDIVDSQVKTPQAVGQQICQSVSRHVGREPAIDDMCVVCIGRTS